MANHEAEQYKARNCHCDLFANGRTVEYVNNIHRIAFLGYRILKQRIAVSGSLQKIVTQKLSLRPSRSMRYAQVILRESKRLAHDISSISLGIVKWRAPS